MVTMSPMVMYLGLAAVVAVVALLFFITPETKSREGSTPRSLIPDVKSFTVGKIPIFYNPK